MSDLDPPVKPEDDRENNINDEIIQASIALPAIQPANPKPPALRPVVGYWPRCDNHTSYKGFLVWVVVIISVSDGFPGKYTISNPSSLA